MSKTRNIDRPTYGGPPVRGTGNRRNNPGTSAGSSPVDAHVLSALFAALKEAVERDPELCHNLQSWLMQNSAPLPIKGHWEHSEDILIPLSVVKEISGLGKTMIYALMKRGEFPAAYKPAGAATRWSRREVREWRRTLQPIYSSR